MEAGCSGSLQLFWFLLSGGIWSQTSSEWHQHAKNWLLAQNWKRSRSTEVAAKRASQAAWFSALAALASSLLALISILIGR
jgi:hypothetical protein